MSSSETRKNAARPIVWFVLEMLIGALLTGSFLAVYILRFGGSSAAIVPHLALLGAAALILIALRAISNRWLPTRAALLVGASLIGAAFVVMTIYYALVLVGMGSWGRVITWILITSYASQAGDLLSALGVSPWTSAIISFAAVGSTLVLSMMWLHRRDWTRHLAMRAAPTSLALGCAAALCIGVLRIFDWSTDPASLEGEPVSMTFFPERASSTNQSHKVGGNILARQADESARAAYRVRTTGGRRNVVLIVGDALRGDHLGVTGYGRATTPFLTTLDQPGKMMKATQMRGVCGESTCGLLGIAKSSFVSNLDLGSFSLYEVLKLHGYSIRMILGGDHTNYYGLREAFGAVDDFYDGSMAAGFYKNDDRLILAHLQTLSEWNGQPQFLQLHLMSSHGTGTRFSANAPYQPSENFYLKTNWSIGGKATDIDEEARNYYDNGVVQFDEVVESAIGILRNKRYLDDALIIITGDHGEMLGEFGEFAHMHSVREGVMRIPFLLISTGRELSSFSHPDDLASQVDIAPSLLYELGLPIPGNWQGVPLQSAQPWRRLPFQQQQFVGMYDSSSDGLRKYFRKLGDDYESVTFVRDGIEVDVPPEEFGLEKLQALRLLALPGASIMLLQPETPSD